MPLTRYKMQPRIGKNLLLAILLASGCGQWYFLSIKRALSSHNNTNSHLETSVLNNADLSLTKTAESPIIYSNISPDIESLTTDTQQAQLEESTRTKDLVKSLQPITRTDDVPASSYRSAEQLLNPHHKDDSEKEISQSVEDQKRSPEDVNQDQELMLKVRPRLPEEIPPPVKKKPTQFQPIGYLRGNVGYFQTNNIFSTNDGRIDDGLIFAGLTLASAYFPVTPNTYINGSINGNVIRYVDQSQFNYNQVRFNLGVYQQLSPEMYAALNLSNQQFFYSNNSSFFAAGDRFLNENSVLLSLGRQDALTDKLKLESLYEVSVNFSDPEKRSRVVNSLWISLNYYLQKPLQVGLNYQVSLSDFTELEREDQFHRLFGHLNYRVSDTSNIYLQGGMSFGGSTTPNINFSSWFFSVSYGFELGRF
jgi:hypothetical protein